LAQVLELGYSRPTVRRRLASGEWEELAPRVYRVASAADADWRASTLACVLAVRGVAGRLSALALYGLLDPPKSPEVVVVRSRRRITRGPQRSSDQLPDADITVVDGIPTTTPVRTLIDSAGRVHRPVFEDVLDTALVQRLVTFDRLRTRAEELWAPRRNGCAIVLALLDERGAEVTHARNVWEAKVLRIVHRLGLPPPKVNHRLRIGGRVRYLDLAWPDVKVAVEFDGFVPHSTRRVFDDDRARQNDLVANGWTVFRVTAPMLRDVDRTFGPIAAAVRAGR
jgi:very-short-patch-repair endonuclease